MGLACHDDRTQLGGRAHEHDCDGTGLQDADGAALALGGSAQARERIQACNERAVDGLGLKPGGGRRPRLLEAERSTLIALARSTPPGRLVPERDRGELLAADEDAAGEWTLDTLTEAAGAQGLQVARSQVRRILRAEGVRWRRIRQWATSTDPEFAPKGRGASPATRILRRARRSSVSTSSVR